MKIAVIGRVMVLSAVEIDVVGLEVVGDIFVLGLRRVPRDEKGA